MLRTTSFHDDREQTYRRALSKKPGDRGCRIAIHSTLLPGMNGCLPLERMQNVTIFARKAYRGPYRPARSRQEACGNWSTAERRCLQWGPRCAYYNTQSCARSHKTPKYSLEDDVFALDEGPGLRYNDVEQMFYNGSATERCLGCESARGEGKI
jgi:hypothetical protein